MASTIGEGRSFTPFMNEQELEAQQHSYFENNRKRERTKRDFAFNTTQINNSPYMVVKGASHMEIVRRGDAAEVGFKHIRNVSMKRSPPRKPFLEIMGSKVHEQRFNLPEAFDKSTYLTTTPRIKSLMPF